MRQPVRAAVLCSADGGGGGGGGAISDGSGDGGGDEDDDTTPEAALSKAGLDADSLPDDVLAALRAGRIGASELVNWNSIVDNPVCRMLAASAFLRNRLLASPQLVSVLGIEITLGLASVLAAEKSARGKNFAKEIDFVLANAMLIVVTNIFIVLALTPAAAIAAPPAAGTYSAWASQLPGFFLQPGSFTPVQRASCFLTKAALFSVLGAGSSSIGQGATLALVDMRTKLNPEDAPTVKLAPVLPTAAAFATFMAFSSNTRCAATTYHHTHSHQPTVAATTRHPHGLGACPTPAVHAHAQVPARQLLRGAPPPIHPRRQGCADGLLGRPA